MFTNPDDPTPVCYLQSGFYCGDLSTAVTFTSPLSTSTEDLFDTTDGFFLGIMTNGIGGSVYTSTSTQPLTVYGEWESSGQGATPGVDGEETTVWSVGSLQSNGAAPISAIWVNPSNSNPAIIAIRDFVLSPVDEVLLYTSSYSGSDQIVYPEFIQLS